MSRPDPPPRAPRVFDIDDPAVTAAAEPEPSLGGGDEVLPSPAEIAAEDHVAADVAPAAGGRFSWGGLLVSALVALATLAAALWFERFVSVALARDDWLGTVAFALLGVAGFATCVIVLREIYGFIKLRQIASIRADADKALSGRDRRVEQSVIRRLKGLVGSSRDHAWDAARFREEERHMRRPGELIALADRVLLSSADKMARRAIYQSARRVAVVTAMVPIAAVVVAYVAIENIRMVRRIAAAYGGRPGLLGGLRLMWRIIGHVAATGLIAFTDDLWGQFLGQDLLRRLSRRFGEGTFNGALTARLGAAAADVCRPLPFVAAPRIRARDILRELFPDLGAAARSVARRAGGKSDADA